MWTPSHDSLTAQHFHLLCDPTLPSGCPRCRPRPTTVCCDLCESDAFEYLNGTSTNLKARAPAKSSIKKFDMTATDHSLRVALFDWRDESAPHKFSAAIIEDIGSHIFMSDEVINRIVKCAHVGKLSSLSELHKETKWRKELVQEFGEALLALVRRFYPPQARPVDSSPNDTGTATRKRGPFKCSACGNLGHTSTSTFLFICLTN